MKKMTKFILSENLFLQKRWFVVICLKDFHGFLENKYKNVIFDSFLK